MYTLQIVPPHLHYVATLPRQSRKSKNVTDFNSSVFMLYVRNVWRLLIVAKYISLAATAYKLRSHILFM